MRRLQGIQDSRGPVGIAARGANVYNSTSHAAHKGGGSQFGRPRKVNRMKTYPQKAFTPGAKNVGKPGPLKDASKPKPFNKKTILRRMNNGR